MLSMRAETLEPEPPQLALDEGFQLWNAPTRICLVVEPTRLVQRILTRIF